MTQEPNAIMEPIILIVEAAMHIVFDLPCPVICQERLLEKHYTEYDVSEPSYETFEASKTDKVRPTLGRWTSEK